MRAGWNYEPLEVTIGTSGGAVYNDTPNFEYAAHRQQLGSH